jgi:hypothetical protein
VSNHKAETAPSVVVEALLPAGADVISRVGPGANHRAGSGASGATLPPGSGGDSLVTPPGPLLDAALEYAAGGLRVVPFRADKKGSLLARGVWKEKATIDAATIRRWAPVWAKPGALIACVIPDGRCVLDIDYPNRLDGQLMPAGPTRVGGRGQQTWLAGDAPYATKLPGDAGELLGAGHIAILPAPGSKYAWSDGRRPWDLDLARVPAWATVGTEPRGWQQPTEDAPIGTRDELVRFVGRYAGLDEAEIFAALVTRLVDGRIVDADPTHPWDPERDFGPIAREFAKKPRPVAPPEEVVIRMVRGPKPVEQPSGITIGTGNDLLAKTLAPLQWAIPEILPEGTTLIVSPPKVGKSALVLQIAVALCNDGIFVLGRRAERVRPVLYLALEDGERRLQDRLRVQLAEAGRDRVDGLDIVRDAPTLGHGLEEFLSSWYDEHQGGAAFIDTLQHVRPEHRIGRGAYDLDVADLRILRDIVRDRPGTILGVVHHTNKPNDAADFVAAVSGTNGIAGTADSILRVFRKRHDPQGKLEVVGRDVPDLELNVRYDDFTWTVDLDAPALPGASPVRNDIYNWLMDHSPAWPAEVAAGVGIERDTAQRRLLNMLDHGDVTKGRGGYSVAVSMRFTRTTPTALISSLQTSRPRPPHSDGSDDSDGADGSDDSDGSDGTHSSLSSDASRWTRTGRRAVLRALDDDRE